MKIFLLLTIFGAIVSLVISLLVGGDLLLNFIDYYFYFGLIILILGIFLYVSGKGFFDFFRWSSKKVFSGYNNSYEDYKNSDESQAIEFGIAKPMIYAGSAVFFITYIIAITMF